MSRRNNTSGSLWIDFLTFWLGLRMWLSGFDWFEITTRATAYLCALALLSSALAIAIAHGWLDLPQLADLLGLPH